MLKRKIIEKIENWKQTKTGQGLLITGARQVGKTSAVEQFARDNYRSFLKIDFVERPDAVELIGEAKSLDDLIVRITALSSSPIASDAKTLLFFDEVQRCGDAITWMRYLAQDNRFDVIYSGSMLGVEAYHYRSLPVGTIDILEMFPMDFEEFSWALGVDKSLWDIVRACYRKREQVPPFIHKRLVETYYRYVLVGGMPEAVQLFVSTHDTQAMRARQQGILEAYRADIVRYAETPAHAQRIRTIYDAMPAQLNKDNKRFLVTGIDKRKRFWDLQPDFDWLVNAGVAIPVKRASEPMFPLGLSREDSFFKFYLSDVGLLFSTFSPADVEAIVAQRDSVNFGQAFENAVAQELRACGYSSLFYFNAAKVGEVDFLIEDKRSPIVLPVEVKSGRYSTKHAALDRLMSVENYGLTQAVVLHRDNVVDEKTILYLPVYMAALLKEMPQMKG